MTRPRTSLVPRDQRGPLNVLFMNTSMPVGGAEILQVQLVREMDSAHFKPFVCCLKEKGPLGELLSAECPVAAELISNKYDATVIGRLRRLMRQWSIDAIVTVGAGDKMFWGRLAARSLGLPVILSAIHSTGWPDVIGRLNRQLTSVTDAFIGVADAHRKYLVETEGFPAEKVVLIPNGVDTERFKFSSSARQELRAQWGIPHTSPCFGLVAALRPEKNHESLLRVAKRVLEHVPEARLVIIGTGPKEGELKSYAQSLGIADSVLFVGSRSDIPQCLCALDAFVLTSKMEASPVSILEALSVQRPVVATRVGSIPESVQPGKTGFLAEVDDDASLAQHVTSLLQDASLREQMGRAGRSHVEQHGSLEFMVRGYCDLIAAVYDAKVRGERFSNRMLAQLDQSPSRNELSPVVLTLGAAGTGCLAEAQVNSSQSMA